MLILPIKTSANNMNAQTLHVSCISSLGRFYNLVLDMLGALTDSTTELNRYAEKNHPMHKQSL